MHQERVPRALKTTEETANKQHRPCQSTETAEKYTKENQRQQENTQRNIKNNKREYNIVKQSTTKLCKRSRG